LAGKLALRFLSNLIIVMGRTTLSLSPCGDNGF
jgi:hypothetical protein